MSKHDIQMHIRDVLERDRQLAIDQARAKPVYATVVWDFEAGAWALECKPCGKKTLAQHPGQFTNKQIERVLWNVAEKHNKECHDDP